MKLSEKKCKYCWGKRYYTVLIGGTSSTGDFIGEPQVVIAPEVKNVACPKCNPKNRRKIKNVQKSIWN